MGWNKKSKKYLFELCWVAIGADNIVSLFANKYSPLYNSVCYEYNEIPDLCNDIRYDIDKYSIKD